jgi:hypothetical protein
LIKFHTLINLCSGKKAISFEIAFFIYTEHFSYLNLNFKIGYENNFLSVALSLATTLTVYSQSDSTLKKQTLHGVVKDEKNKPIQNANVIVEGEEIGTVTDSLGYFKIDARPNAVLIINADGFEPLLKEINSKELVEAVMSKAKPQNDNGGSNEILKQPNTFQVI